MKANNSEPGPPNAFGAPKASIDDAQIKEFLVENCLKKAKFE